MASTASVIICCIVTVALAVCWAALAQRALQAWRSRAEAVEHELAERRFKKSVAVSKGNRTRAAHRRQSDQSIASNGAGQIQLDLAAKQDQTQ